MRVSLEGGMVVPASLVLVPLAPANIQSAVHVPSDAVGRDWLSTAPAQSPSDPFWAFKELAQIARKYALYLSVGVIECSNIGSTLWCTNLLFGPSGMLLSKHRKLQPTGAERIVWSQGEAVNPSSAPRADKRDAEGNTKTAQRIEEGDDNLPVVQTPVGRIGALICWENYMPLARYVMYKKGVEVYLAPTADGRQTWLPSMQHIAMEGRCYVITANQYQSQADFPAEYPPNLAAYSTSAHNTASGQGVPMAVDEKEKSKEANAPEVWSRGGSAIVGPLGEVLAGPLWDKEGIIYADVSERGRVLLTNSWTSVSSTVSSSTSTPWATTAGRASSWACWATCRVSRHMNLSVVKRRRGRRPGLKQDVNNNMSDA